MHDVMTSAGATTAGFVDVGSASDVPMLEGRSATVAGRRVAVFRLPTGYAATDAACPHRGGPLSDGLVADGCVTCPLHNWRLDLTTGVVKGDDTVVPIHDVLVLDDRLWVRIAADAGPAPAPAPRVTAGDAARLWDPTASGATSTAAESAPSLADGPGGRPADDAATGADRRPADPATTGSDPGRPTDDAAAA
jgi:nitrite reductase (NADH) small subunit